MLDSSRKCVSIFYKTHEKFHFYKIRVQFHENLLMSDRQTDRLKHWVMKDVQVTGQKQDFSDFIISKQAELSSKMYICNRVGSRPGQNRTETL